MNNLICRSCKEPFIRNHTPESYLDGTCFDCSFWLKKVTMSKQDEARRVIVAGQHFMIGLNSSGPRGFGGRKHIIRFNDGRTIETHNLWSQGEIPDRFRLLLPDNARFIPNKDELQISGLFDVEDR